MHKVGLLVGLLLLLSSAPLVADDGPPSPWVAAAWIPLRDNRVAGEDSMGLDYGMGVALHSFEHPVWWRFVPAVFLLGIRSVAIGPAWVVSQRDDRRVVAVGAGIGVPWDD